MSYKIYENGKFIANAKTKKDWERVVTGLNSSMDVVDAPYPEIRVMNDRNRCVYLQTGGSP